MTSTKAGDQRHRNYPVARFTNKSELIKTRTIATSITTIKTTYRNANLPLLLGSDIRRKIRPFSQVNVFMLGPYSKTHRMSFIYDIVKIMKTKAAIGAGRQRVERDPRIAA
jgi:hypothetical protein